jgi:hypothetical protein
MTGLTEGVGTATETLFPSDLSDRFGTRVGISDANEEEDSSGGEKVDG